MAHRRLGSLVLIFSGLTQRVSNSAHWLADRFTRPWSAGALTPSAADLATPQSGWQSQRASISAMAWRFMHVAQRDLFQSALLAGPAPLASDRSRNQPVGDQPPALMHLSGLIDLPVSPAQVMSHAARCRAASVRGSTARFKQFVPATRLPLQFGGDSGRPTIRPSHRSHFLAVPVPLCGCGAARGAGGPTRSQRQATGTTGC